MNAMARRDRDQNRAVDATAPDDRKDREKRYRDGARPPALHRVSEQHSATSGGPDRRASSHELVVAHRAGLLR